MTRDPSSCSRVRLPPAACSGLAAPGPCPSCSRKWQRGFPLQVSLPFELRGAARGARPGDRTPGIGGALRRLPPSPTPGLPRGGSGGAGGLAGSPCALSRDASLTSRPLARRVRLRPPRAAAVSGLGLPWPRPAVEFHRWGWGALAEGPFLGLPSLPLSRIPLPAFRTLLVSCALGWSRAFTWPILPGALQGRGRASGREARRLVCSLPTWSGLQPFGKLAHVHLGPGPAWRAGGAGHATALERASMPACQLSCCDGGSSCRGCWDSVSWSWEEVRPVSAGKVWLCSKHTCARTFMSTYPPPSPVGSGHGYDSRSSFVVD